MPDEITIVVGDKGERPIVIAQSLDDGYLLLGVKGKPLDLERSVTVRGQFGPDFHWAPVEPKPPSPRVVGGSSSTHSAASSGTATTTS